MGLGSIQGYEDRKIHPPIQRIVALKNLVLRFSNIKTGPSIVIRLTIGVLCPPRPIPGNVVNTGKAPLSWTAYLFYPSRPLLTRTSLPSRDHLLPHRVKGHGHLKAARGFYDASSCDRRATPTESHGGGLCVCSRPELFLN